MTAKRMRSKATPLPRPRVTDAVRLAAIVCCDDFDFTCSGCPLDNSSCGTLNIKGKEYARQILRAAGVKLRGKA
jgi:hypothetical protein